MILAVVDPNVGKDREIAVETTSGRHLVGPDNGLLSLGWEAAGGVRKAVEITSTPTSSARHTPSRSAHRTRCARRLRTWRSGWRSMSSGVSSTPRARCP